MQNFIFISPLLFPLYSVAHLLSVFNFLNYNLTEDEIKDCSTFFETTYGFNPLDTK